MPKKETVAKKKVLIVEDEGDMCLLMDIILHGKDVEVDHVKNIAAAKDYLKEEQPSVVLLDNKLPDGYGVDFLPDLKKQYPSIKVAMVSGYDGSAEDVAYAQRRRYVHQKTVYARAAFQLCEVVVKLNTPIFC